MSLFTSKVWRFTILIIIVVLLLSACQWVPTPTAEPQEFVFGMVMVGPYNDHGWNQAHYDAGLYVEEKIPGAMMIYIDKVNPGERPGTTPAILAEDLVSKGAKLVIFNSDDMKDSAIEFTAAHPDVWVIHASGDTVWKDGKSQYHGSHGIWQNDRRLHSCPNDQDWQDRLSWPPNQ
jgi:basic membrane lipoprotein Med (substrate-binding protein (PBP1-ABC) superfamily)